MAGLSGDDEDSSLLACGTRTAEGVLQVVRLRTCSHLRSDKLDPEERAEKPILITRFNKHSDEWLDAIYYNVRTGEKCRVTVADRTNDRIPVKTYREILHQYLYHPECKFAGPDGCPCDPWTRGVLQRRHIVAAELKCCGKEIKRKLEQGPVDHEIDYKYKVYENGLVAADSSTLLQLEEFSEREISDGTGLHRKTIRIFRHGGTVTGRTYQKIATFLREQAGSCALQKAAINKIDAAAGTSAPANNRDAPY